MSESIKMNHAALDETLEGEIILRGRIDPDSLPLLQVADYQREVLPLTTITSIIEGFHEGSIPDIDLGMRGEKYLERGPGFYLQNPVYIIDGLQRVSAARQIMQENGGRLPRLGATVHFGTNEEWERDRFKILNADRTKLSSNVLLRNMRYDVEVVDLLYRLCQDKTFVLHGRVNWQQRMRRSELISAVTLLKVSGALHAHIGPGKSSGIKELGAGAQKIMGRTGKNIFRDNVKTFFHLVDQCWGIQCITYSGGAPYIRSSYLMVLATVLSNHTNFWKENRLFIEAPLIRKIKLFPVSSDPYVASLCSATGKAKEILYNLIVGHINSGKRTRKLQPRTKAVEIPS